MAISEKKTEKKAHPENRIRPKLPERAWIYNSLTVFKVSDS